MTDREKKISELKFSQEFIDNSPRRPRITLFFLNAIFGPIERLIKFGSKSWQAFINFLYRIVKTLLVLKYNTQHSTHAFQAWVIDTFSFVKDYYMLNDLIWQDGFLIDFLQKKVADKWIRKFVIYSGYLFNERWLFDYVVRFYITLVIWPGYRLNIYEFNNVASTLLVTLFLAMTLFLIVGLLYFGVTLL